MLVGETVSVEIYLEVKSLKSSDRDLSGEPGERRNNMDGFKRGGQQMYSVKGQIILMNILGLVGHVFSVAITLLQL